MVEPSIQGQKAAPQVDNLRGALWMLGSAATMAASSVAIKVMGHHLPPLEVAFMRSVTGVCVLLPIILRHGVRVYATPSPQRHLIRIVLSCVSITSGIYGLVQLQLATAVSLSFTRPLFMIVIALIVLHETVGWRRGLATAVGFLGVLVVMGPTEVNSMPAVMASLLSAATLAGTMAVVRQQSAYDRPATILCWVTTGVTLMLAIPAFLVWQPPTLFDWGIALFLGVIGSGGQYMMIRAFTIGEATVMNPIDYSQIILTTIAGYMLFAEIPTIWTAIGTVIIVASTLYIVLREAALAKSAGAKPHK